jgi:23S rRNA (cytidine1920-2'-O)/16S rRNA (cytidine1409-2'-O)-methyltransferase
MNRKKQRLDLSVYKQGLAPSRQRARTLIMAGKILVNRQPIDKPGAVISDEDVIELKGADIPYVSRGGLKLAEALTAFNLNVIDLVCLDVGASTGGFTDCLLQNGARRVYAVDVGYGQLAWKLRQDERVVIIERTNIRHMPPDAVGDPIALVTVDVSFISLKIVIPAIIPFMAAGADIVALIKPQFEVGKGKVGKGGIVSDPDLHREVVEDLSAFFSGLGLTVVALISSPIRGAKGNLEFLIHLEYRASKS